MLRYKRLFTKLSPLAGLAVVFLFLAILGGGTAYADRIGVGVGTGRIDIDNPLKPGLTYDLPNIAVFNNGDVAADYEMSVQFNETQPQQKPKAEWISFKPQKFKLEPGKSQQVSIAIRTSSSARPGEYFAYLEAHPLKTDVSGQTAINIAAATKFSFKVKDANLLQKLLYWLQDLWNKHKSLIILIAAIGLIILLVWLNKKFLRVELRRKE